MCVVDELATLAMPGIDKSSNTTEEDVAKFLRPCLSGDAAPPVVKKALVALPSLLPRPKSSATTSGYGSNKTKRSSTKKPPPTRYLGVYITPKLEEEVVLRLINKYNWVEEFLMGIYIYF